MAPTGGAAAGQPLVDTLGSAGAGVHDVVGTVASNAASHVASNAATGGGGHVTVLAGTPRPSGSGSGLASIAQTLPFTGVNVFFMVLTAITMLLMGVTLLRIGRTLTTRETTA